MLDALADGADHRGEVALRAELDAATIARDCRAPGAHARTARQMIAAERAVKSSCPVGSTCDAAFNGHLATISTSGPACPRRRCSARK